MGYKDFIKIMGAFLTIILIFYVSLAMILVPKSLKNGSDYIIIEEPSLTKVKCINYGEAVVKNLNKDRQNIKIYFSLYDKDDNKIGVSTDEIQNLKANETWKINSLILENDVDSIQIERITTQF
jgi:hypothetical protein